MSDTVKALKLKIKELEAKLEDFESMARVAEATLDVNAQVLAKNQREAEAQIAHDLLELIMNEIGKAGGVDLEITPDYAPNVVRYHASLAFIMPPMVTEAGTVET